MAKSYRDFAKASFAYRERESKSDGAG